MAKINLTDISSGYTSLSTYNENNSLLESAIENTLSRDGTVPNTMEATLDMNSHRVTNLPDAVANQEPITLAQAASIASVTTPLTQDTVAAVLYPATSAETGAGVTLTDKYELPGNYHRYGATGDGSADDGTAVNAAINQSLQVGGVLPFGRSGATYLCTTWTPIDTTTVVRIGGTGYTLKGPTTQVDFCRPGSSFELAQHVYLEHWLSALERETGDTGTLTNFSIDYGRFTDFTGRVISLERALSNFRLASSRFENTDGGYVVRLGTNSFANQATWNKIELLSNHFKDIDGASTTSTAASLIYGKDINIIGNFVEGVDQTGTGEAWGFYTKALYGIIAFNHIDTVAAAGNSDNSGLNIKGTARGTSATPNGIGSLTIGNIIRDLGTSNVRGIGIRSQADEHYAALNYIEDAGLIGVLYDGVTSDLAASLFNRVIFGTDTGTIGISFAQGGRDIRSIGDLVDNAATGIRLAADASSAAENMVVAEGVFRATGSAIQTNPSSTNIDGLHIRNNITPSSPTVGLQFNGGTLLTNVHVLDNDFAGATTEISGTIPADIHLRHVFEKQTTTASATQAISLALPDEAAFRVEAKVVAKSSDTVERAMYHKTALVYRDAAGSATIQGSVIDTSADVEVTGGMNATITVNGNSVRVTVTGIAATTIDWKIELNILGIG